MENLSHSSYPESGDSSPRSRDIDEHQSWEEPPTNYKVKLMCSYGGKIQPRNHDNLLAYIGGDTKILAVDRNIKFSLIMNKLISLCGGETDICIRYQLPGEDLDALISVTNDEDLEHMMLEYDRLYRGSAKPARLRLFLSYINPSSFGSDEVKSERQWFVDALNSVPVNNLESFTSPAPAAVSVGNPDFLFGLEKGFSTVPIPKFTDAAPPPTVPEIIDKDVTAGLDCGSDDRHVTADVNQQIPDLQRLQISAAHEQARKIEQMNNTRGFAVEYYAPKVSETISSLPPLPQVAVPVLMQVPSAYLQERHVTTGAPVPEHTAMYQIPTAAGVYRTPPFRPVTGQMGQGYYGVQRVVQEVYRDQPPVYNVAPPLQQAKVGVYGEGVGVVQAKVGVAEQGYLQAGYDSAGRQVYYTTAPYVVGSDDRQGGGGGGLNQDGKVQTSNV